MHSRSCSIQERTFSFFKRMHLNCSVKIWKYNLFLLKWIYNEQFQQKSIQHRDRTKFDGFCWLPIEYYDLTCSWFLSSLNGIKSSIKWKNSPAFPVLWCCLRNSPNRNHFLWARRLQQNSDKCHFPAPRICRAKIKKLLINWKKEMENLKAYQIIKVYTYDG